jgi:O-antigen/teichoic acid export membrane protein
MSRTLRNILWIFASIVLAKAIGIVTSLLIPKILGPANYGIWVTMLLILQYAPIASLGTVEALIKQFPYHAARGEIEEARGIEEGVFGSIIVGSVLWLLLGLLFPLVMVVQAFQPVFPMMRVMVLAASLGLFSAFFSFRLVAHQRFKLVGLTDTFRSVALFVLLVSFSYAWSLNGSAFGYLASEFIVCMLLAIVSTYACGKIGVKFAPHLLLELIKIGLPITIVWWIYILQTSAGSLISMTFLGKTATGYLGLGISASSILVLIPDAVNRVLYPRINEEVGKSSNNKSMERVVITPSRIISLMLALFIGLLLLILPTLYKEFFLKFWPGLLCGQILFLGAFFSCLVRSGANYLIAKDKQALLLRYVLISLVTNVLGNIFLIKIGLGIEGIALGTAFSSVLLTTLVWMSVFRIMGYDNAEQWKALFNLYYPLILTIFLILVIKVLFRGALLESSFLSFLYMGLFLTIFLGISSLVPFYRGCFMEIYHIVKINKLSKVVVE